jgi:tetratricopeptide (TPR) repeat protein
MSGQSFTHILDHPHVRAVEHYLAANPDSGTDAAFWQRTKELMVSGAEKSHREASMVMHQYQATKRPFGLFLRSFEVEAYQYFSADCVPGRDGGTVWTSINGPSSVEQKIAGALVDRLPLIAIANPSQLETARGIIPRLQLPDEGWQQVAQNLIEHAHLIVMDCDAFAPGVLWELETIATLRRADATVIILPPRGVEPSEATSQTIADVFGAVVKRLEPATKEDARLAGHRRLAYEDEIDFDRIEQSPLFSDLLADAAERSAQAPAFDPKLYARLLNNSGVEQANNQQFAEAFNLYTQALLIRRHIDDREGIMVTLRNLGTVCTDAGQCEPALPYFDEALRLARELDRVDEAGVIAAYKGFAHKQLGQREEAIKWLRAGYVFQAAAGSHEELETTLVQLAEVHREAGEGDEMIECYRLLREHYRTSGDRAGELKTNLRMAETYWLAGHYANALTLFNEGLRLSSEVADTEMEDLCKAAIQKLLNEHTSS